MGNCNAKAILAFDCATPNASVALLVAGHVRTKGIEKGRHASELVAVIDGLLHDANCRYEDISTIVTTTGPGSFTGLRIALSVAHGLHLAHNTPMKCTSGLAAIAHHYFTNHPNAPQVRAVMAVGKGEVAYQDFNLDRAIGDITRTPESDQTVFNGGAITGTFAHPDVMHVPGIDAAWLCDMADALPITPIDAAVPLYIRPPDAIIPQAPRWLAS